MNSYSLNVKNDMFEFDGNNDDNGGCFVSSLIVNDNGDSGDRLSAIQKRKLQLMNLLFRNNYVSTDRREFNLNVNTMVFISKTHTLFHEARPLFIQEEVGVKDTTYVMAYLILH